MQNNPENTPSEDLSDWHPSENPTWNGTFTDAQSGGPTQSPTTETSN